MNEEWVMKANRYDVVRTISEESYKKAMAALEHGHIEKAQKHMEVFEKYNLRASELRRELFVELEGVKNESL